MGMRHVSKQPVERSRFRRTLNGALYLILTAMTVLALSWAGAALWFDGPTSRLLSYLLLGALVLACGTLLQTVRPYILALAAILTLVGLITIWWLAITPSNDRDWLPDVAKLTTAELMNNQLTIHNQRNINYRSETDFDSHWETRHYDLEKLRSLDIFLCYWGPTNIAHTILSWGFDNDRYLAISIETRKERGETYSAVRGFFRQYEVYYVVADERDVVRLRTNYRGEQLYLYRMSVTRSAAKDLLLDYIEEINRLAEHPRWYNALTHNCTTAIRYHSNHVTTVQPWDLRMLVNGQVDQMLYERKRVATSIPFEVLRRESAISDKAKKSNLNNFSRQIRIGLIEPDI